MKVYLLCPVRQATSEIRAFLSQYIRSLESMGIEVFYPATCNLYEAVDQVGDKICKANMEAIKESDEVHVYWLESSAGIKFDLGIAFVFEKPLVIINSVDATGSKSFGSLLLGWPFGVRFYHDDILEEGLRTPGYE